MAQGPSPLVGYNTNVRHKGKLYHIQTEDSGVNHPHIITHMFADGGRIIASSKTSYAERVGEEDLRVTVKQMMKDQHKAMFIALRDGVYDVGDDVGAGVGVGVGVGVMDRDSPATAGLNAAPETSAAAASEAPVAAAEQTVDLAALDAAAARISEHAPRARYGSARPPAATAGKGSVFPGPPSDRPTANIFSSELLSEKSLDEVILSYLAEDLEDA